MNHLRPGVTLTGNKRPAGQTPFGLTSEPAHQPKCAALRLSGES